ncbi:hypothetical protein COV11_01855 [Candidatus Woesearchaeota archaeon CG10_big_fil_rev_8_21_14_0_10_30_7]|nr:MAG: hypothetical protein COV11_01855 [Candidatus Woesearchaeota archaeon CG10_big_fil_rev_8_21_14_0_10_30_7]
MAESLLSGVITFLEKLGVYDVVLPFLLVFTILFAILEKTRLFGEEEIDGKKYSRKNLNSMAAFVIGFLVIASSQLVEAISQISAQIVVVLMLSIFFLLLVGSFYEEGQIGKEGLKEAPWARNAFVVITFFAIAFIFLNALPAGQGQTWLEWIFEGTGDAVASPAFASIVLIIVIILFIIFITRPNKPTGEGGTTNE